MKYIKISNLTPANTTICDYKGLDINLIVPGSQLYPDNENAAYFQYAGSVSPGADIEIITEQQHAAKKQEMISMQPKSPLQLLEEENAALRARLDVVENAMLFMMDMQTSQ